MENINPRIKVKRVPKRGHYDKATIYKILDSLFICHVGFVHKEHPVVIPTLYGRSGNELLLHGAVTSRMMSSLSEGIDVSIAISKVTGMVLARSAFHHSANYESVVIFGKAYLIEGEEEKFSALESISNHFLPGRWEEVRLPSKKELKATMLLKISLDQASAKIRTGGPIDDKADYNLDIWAGTVPMEQVFEQVIPDPLLEKKIDCPESVKKLFK